MLVTLNKKRKKVLGGKKLSNNVLVVPLDNASFHSEESVLKWKYIYTRRIFPERKLSKGALKCYEIMEML